MITLTESIGLTKEQFVSSTKNGSPSSLSFAKVYIFIYYFFVLYM